MFGCIDAVLDFLAGYPKHLVTDQGLNNRGVAANELPAAGVHVGTIGPQAPYNRQKSNATVEFGNLPEQSHCFPIKAMKI